MKSLRRAVLHKAGSKASNAVLPSAAGIAVQRLQALIVGPVTKLVSGNKGLCVAERDTSELSTSSLGTCQLLWDTKPHQLAQSRTSLQAASGRCLLMLTLQ